jgi:hypothetical protein
MWKREIVELREDLDEHVREQKKEMTEFRAWVEETFKRKD